MSSVVERLIESWLDSQTERRYQPAFIQLLVSEGWAVLHNTRHSPIEFGKDVIARDPKGTLYCFQLKGNPGGRITKTEAQGLLPQLIELLEIPPGAEFRRRKSERYIGVLVTNGEIDEEARLVLEGAGARTAKATCPSKSFDLWTRGILLSRFQRAAGNIWPTSVEGIRGILDILARDGREIPDPQRISTTFEVAVPPPSGNASNSAKSAALSSLLVLSEILKAPWYASENHYGLYVLTVLTSIYALRFADSAKRLSATSQYANMALEHCADLIQEAKSRNYEPDKVWADRDILAEVEIMWERRRLIGDCAAVLILSNYPEAKFDRDYASELVETTFLAPKIWGLAAVPALIVRYWATCQVRAASNLDLRLGTHLSAILAANLGLNRNGPPLAAPYYGFVDCWAYQKELPFFAKNDIFFDSFIRRMWFARALLFMLAKRNCKQTCKRIWSLFSSLVHEDPDLPSKKFFDSLPIQESWLGLFEQFSGFYKWNLCRVQAAARCGSRLKYA